MAAKSFMGIGTFVRRNILVILFPTFAASTIWLDWSHTRRWKEQKKLASAQ